MGIWKQLWIFSCCYYQPKPASIGEMGWTEWYIRGLQCHLRKYQSERLLSWRALKNCKRKEGFLSLFVVLHTFYLYLIIWTLLNLSRSFNSASVIKNVLVFPKTYYLLFFTFRSWKVLKSLEPCTLIQSHLTWNETLSLRHSRRKDPSCLSTTRSVVFDAPNEDYKYNFPRTLV